MDLTGEQVLWYSVRNVAAVIDTCTEQDTPTGPAELCREKKRSRDKRRLYHTDLHVVDLLQVHFTLDQRSDGQLVQQVGFAFSHLIKD